MRLTSFLHCLPAINWYGRRDTTIAKSMACLILGPFQFILGWHGNLTTRYVFQLEDTGVHEFRRTYSIQLHEFLGPPAWGIFTFRTPNGTETKIYVSPRRLWWNSEHIAYRFGEPMEDDPRLEGGAIYQGWLGTHIAC